MEESKDSDDEQILSKMANHFHKLVSDKEELRTAVECFFNNLVDELTLGIIFDEHRKFKTGVYQPEMEVANVEELPVGAEVFPEQDVSKITCKCPNCGRVVAAIRFAPHLATCMGVGRTRSTRSTRKRMASSSLERKNSSFSEEPSDDKDDEDGNWESKRPKKKKRNESKKSKSVETPKTFCDSSPSDDIDVEAVDECPLLRGLLLGYLNSSSMADSASSISLNLPKKKAKTGNKKGKKVKVLPNPTTIRLHHPLA
ncbi:SAGA-associated factor 11 homolog-like protein [Tribolium castaneum]|uniref:SAGA-associated factor 11 n=1 Tax=Tribolium castaneum TaxID=7070 RepID=A0A139WI52_TRICA|nr:SAGA-associated factor 11 homolog-like protein [Tribolium castaneum]